MEMAHSAMAQAVSKKIENILQAHVDHTFGTDAVCIRVFPLEEAPKIEAHAYWQTASGELWHTFVPLDLEEFIQDILAEKFEYLLAAVRDIATQVNESTDKLKAITFGGHFVNASETIQ